MQSWSQSGATLWRTRRQQLCLSRSAATRSRGKTLAVTHRQALSPGLGWQAEPWTGTDKVVQGPLVWLQQQG
jgi:hypothetical protein